MSDIATAVNIRKNLIDSWNYHADFTSVVGGDGSRGVQMQVVTYLFQYSDFTSEQGPPEYFFYLIHECTFAPQNLYIDDHADRKGWFARWYKLNSLLIGPDGQPLTYEQATLQETDPATTEGQVTYQRGVTTGFSASGGFFGEAPTGSVGLSYSVSDSRSYTVKDVTIKNKSLQNALGPTANWEFGLKPSQLVDSNLDAPADLGNTTFQATLYQLWNMPHRIADAVTMRLTLEVEIEYATRSSQWVGLQHTCDYKAFEYTNTRDIQLVYAPDPGVVVPAPRTR
jgi:hypothetical protein